MAISGGDGSIILTTKIDETGIEKGMSKLKSGIGAVGKAATLAGAAVTAGFVAITKSAVQSYAEYEQLAGGTQKIFDEMDYSKIAEDAGNAYKTMGMNANEYLGVMTTVGANFASTLGDAKGYEVAKQGMQAISDFASGTGRSVDELSEKYQMITKSTSSYQSIADQFAGILPATSAAFLEQAQAAGFLSDSYTKLTEVPMAEYQEAVTQMLSKGVDALGLTNNTAMEASTTLSGATAMLKASWENLLTGIADPSQDFNRLLDNLISSVGAFTSNILPTIKNAASGVLEMVRGLLPQAGSIVSELLPIVLEGASGILVGIVEIAPQIADTILGLLPTFVQSTSLLIIQIANQLPQLMQIIVDSIPILMNSVISALPETVPVLIGALVDCIVILAASYNQVIQPLIDNLPIVVRSVGEAIISNLPILLSALLDLVVEVARSIPSLLAVVIESLMIALEMSWSNIRTYLEGIWEGIKSVFKPAIEFFSNLVSGIENTFSSIDDYLGSKFREAWEKIKSTFSPWAQFFGGLWNTVKAKFTDFGTKMGDAIGGAVKSGINGAISLIERTINRAINIINGGIGLMNLIPGVSVGKIGAISLPRLAKGMVIPGGREFLAVLGDQPKGQTNIEAPLETIKQGVAEVIGVGGVGSESIELTLLLDSDIIYKKVVQKNRDNTIRTGKNALAY